MSLGFERMSAEYNKGYTDALLRIQQELGDGLAADMRYHHSAFTLARAREFISAVIKDRAILRDRPEAFVRMNKNKEFEVYVPKRD